MALCALGVREAKFSSMLELRLTPPAITGVVVADGSTGAAGWVVVVVVGGSVVVVGGSVVVVVGGTVVVVGGTVVVVGGTVVVVGRSVVVVVVGTVVVVGGTVVVVGGSVVVVAGGTVVVVGGSVVVVVGRTVVVVGGTVVFLIGGTVVVVDRPFGLGGRYAIMGEAWTASVLSLPTPVSACSPIDGLDAVEVVELQYPQKRP